jgi:hypothetical protein
MGRPDVDAEDLAEQTLAALAGPQCGQCGEELDRTRFGWECPSQCPRYLCPVCGHDETESFYDGMSDSYAHLLAACTDDYVWLASPFACDDFPRMEAADEDARRDEVYEAVYERSSEVFGAAAPLLDAYWEGPYDPPIEEDLRERILGELSVPVRDTGWGTGHYYYTPRPAEAEAQIEALLDRLHEGFRRLSQGAPEG